MSAVPPVFADKIIPATCLIEYINQTNLFYVENDFYPLPKKSSATSRTLKPFVNTIYSTKDGAGYKTPDIYFKSGSFWTKNYSILWNTSDKSKSKTFFANTFAKDSKDSEEKKTSIENYTFSSCNVDDSSCLEDKILRILSFHLSEVFTILLYSYIYDIDLGSDEFRACSDNVTLYRLIEERINKKLEMLKLPSEFEINEDMVAKYNGDVYYTKDEGNDAKYYPAFWESEVDDPVKIQTLQTFIYKLHRTATYGKKGGIPFRFDKYFGEEKAKLLKFIKDREHLDNKTRHTIYYNKRDDKLSSRFQFSVKTMAVNRSVVPVGHPVEFYCTRYFNKSTRKICILTSKDEYMKELAKKRLTGNVYFKFEFKLSTIAKGSFVLGNNLSMIDVSIQTSDKAYVDYYEQQALERNKDEELITLKDEYYDEVSEDDDAEDSD